MLTLTGSNQACSVIRLLRAQQRHSLRDSTHYDPLSKVARFPS